MHEVVVDNTNLEIRGKIKMYEEKLAQQECAVVGDSHIMPLRHYFADGCYVREMLLPKGTIVVGKIHKHAHPSFIMVGEVKVVSESGGVEYIKAPQHFISPPGTKRIVHAIEDTIWVTVHVTEKTELEEVEEDIISQDYKDVQDSYIIEYAKDKLGQDIMIYKTNTKMITEGE